MFAHFGSTGKKRAPFNFLFFPPHMVDVCMTAIDSRDPGSPGGVRGRIWDILQTQSAGGTASQQGGPPVRDSGRGLS